MKNRLFESWVFYVFWCTSFIYNTIILSCNSSIDDNNNNSRCVQRYLCQFINMNITVWFLWITEKRKACLTGYYVPLEGMKNWTNNTCGTHDWVRVFWFGVFKLYKAELQGIDNNIFCLDLTETLSKAGYSSWSFTLLCIYVGCNDFTLVIVLALLLSKNSICYRICECKRHRLATICLDQSGCFT